MTPARWAQIKEIFGAALEKPESERAGWLDSACGGDSLLRAEVERLLAQDEESLKSPAATLLAHAAPGLAVGEVLSHYRVDATIGQGGMGVVYRAYDTRLHRQVALKVLPPGHLADPESQHRLMREARAASALNHPNIVGIYEVASDNGVDFIAMEFVEGKTLHELIPGKGLPLGKALEYAIQIASGLAKAHAAGIVHRDLKPGNIMVTGDGLVKLLDFGLARRVRLEPGQQTTVTAEGEIAGTPAYMSPEQAEGKPLDARSDVFSFGLVLYQMLTGRQAFSGDSAASAMAAVLREEPAPLGEKIPREVAKIVERCLRKDPVRRPQHMDDLKLALEELKEDSASGKLPAEIPHQGRPRRWLAVGVATVLVFAAVTVGWMLVRDRMAGPPSSLVRLNVSLSTWGLTLTDGGLALSPDGETLVFAACATSGEPRLYARRVREWEPRPLAGTEQGYEPFLSPDGKWVAFAVRGHGLQKVPVGGGAPQPLCAIGDLFGGAWGRDGRIIVGGYWQGKTGLWSVPEEGGAPRLLIQAPGTSDSVWQMWPDVLPGSRWVVFTLRRPGQASIAAFSLQTGEVRTLIESGWRARYLATGHLVYESGGHLYVVPFDAERLMMRGASRIVVENVGNIFEQPDDYAISLNGTLAYAPSSTRLGRLVWKDRRGSTTPLRLPPAAYLLPALSPDGRRLAVTIENGAVRNVWIGGVEGEALTRLTSGTDDVFSLFTPDGKHVAFTSDQNGRYNLFWAPTDGSGQAERLVDSPDMKKPTSWFGRTLLFNNIDKAGDVHIWRLDVDRKEARPFVKTGDRELEAVVSPDGRWVAYESTQSGNWEIYVEAYPGPGTRNRVSVSGGIGARWHPKGGELFYQSGNTVWAVRVQNGRPVGSAERVFTLLPYWQFWSLERQWDIGPDGRFLVVECAEAGAQLNLVTNWFEELKARVPHASR